MKRKPIVVAALAGVVAAGGIAFVATHDKPKAVEELQNAQEAGNRAATQRDEILQNLDDIASNIEEGAGLSDRGDEIGDLTQKQGESLQQLADLLRDQLHTLESTQQTLETTSSAASGIARIGRSQSHILAATV